MGFIPYDETLTLLHAGKFPAFERPPQAEMVTAREVDELVAFDQAFFGAERGRVFRALLEVFPERAFCLRDEQNRISG